jgi:hypothetical protein
MGKCPVCDELWEPCYLCRQGEPHQRCVNDSMCHECIMKEKWGEPESANQSPDADGSIPGDEETFNNGQGW